MILARLLEGRARAINQKTPTQQQNEEKKNDNEKQENKLYHVHVKSYKAFGARVKNYYKNKNKLSGDYCCSTVCQNKQKKNKLQKYE